MLDRVNKNLMLFSTRFLKQKEYWIHKLSGDIEKTEILFNQHENKRDNEKGNIKVKRDEKRKNVPISMPENLCTRLMNFSKKIDLSLYLLLLTGLKTLIYRYTNREDIVVISPIYKQSISGETINNFLFIRNFVSGYMTFKELLLEIRESVVNAYENQDYPFDILIEHLFPQEPDNGFVSNISCSLGNIHNHNSIETLPIKLAFAFNREGNRIKGNVIFDPNIDADTYLQQISNHFTRILEEATNDINIKISKILILSNQERKQLLLEFNNTQAKYSSNKTIVELFEQQVEKKPDNIALVFGDKNVSYRESNKRSNQLGKKLREKGTAINSIVGIMLEPSMEMLIGIIGVLKAGGTFLPMEPEHPGPRIKYMLMDSNARILLTQEHPKGKCAFEVKTINLEDKRLYRGKGLNLEKRTSPADLTYVIYTSGTTGNPKGVLIKNENLVNYVNWFVKEISITMEDRAILTSSFAFDALYTQLFASILRGCELHVIPRETFLIPQQLLSYLRARKISYIKVTPSLFNLVINSPGFSLEMFRKIRFIMLGGEPINIEDVDHLYRICRHIKIMNHYGPTETTIGSIARFIDYDKFEDYKKNLTIGKPINNTKVYILDKHLALVPLGVTAELCIGGDGVGLGYLNNQELTVEKFIANPFVIGGRLYRTGDLASWQPDGNIKFWGRMDDQIKIRGYRVELGGIENLLLKHNEIKDVGVIHKNGYLCAYVVSEKKLLISQLREYLSKKLPDYMIPSYFMQLESIPLTPHNKIDRKALPEPEVNSQIEYIAPRTPMEEKLIKIWSEVLAVKKNIIGINSNFFELGGHSLNATRAVSKMYHELYIKIPLVEFFKNPTIEMLAEYLKGTAEDIYSFIKPVEEKE